MRGGKRDGAGRPKGSRSTGTKERLRIAEEALREGITPLDVMLRTMRALWEAEQFQEACVVARDAAPYVHARLSSIEGNMAATLAYLPAAQSQPVPVEDREPNPKLNGHSTP